MIDATALASQLASEGKGRAVFAELPDGPLSYRQLWQQVRQAAAMFDALEVSPAGRVLIITESDRHAIVLFVAALLDGRCPVLLPADTPDARIEAIAGKLSPDCIFIDGALQLALPWLHAWKTIPIEDARPGRAGVLARLLGERRAAHLAFPAILDQVDARDPLPSGDPGQLAFIAFTSGTTAAPKGVMTTHANLWAHLDTLVRQFDYDRGSRILNNMVLSHNDGLVQGPLLALACAGTLLRPRPLDVRTIGALLDDVYALKATHFITVPTVLAIATQRAEHDDYFKGEEFKHLVSVAAKLDPLVWQQAERRFGVRISNIYGLTETVAGGLFCGPDDDSHAIGTIGLPVDMDAMVVDAQGAELPAGMTGELWLRGSNATPGYWRDPSSTAEIYSGSWLRTGDLARVRPDGKYEICGRIKALVVSGGFSVHPDEVDEVLQAHPQVAESASVGIPHAEWGEVLVSAVSLSTPVATAMLLQHCRDRLEPKKLPTRIIVVQSLPRGRSGKVDRNALARLFLQPDMCGPTTGPGGAVLERLLALAGETFKRPPDALSVHDTPDSISGWDSLNHLQLIVAIEKAFGIELGMVEVMRAQSLGDLLDIVETALAPA